MKITLTTKQHAYLISFLPNDMDRTRLKYVNSVAKVIDINNEGISIEVEVPESLILDIYQIMGNTPERVTASMNKEIQAALLPQIQGSTVIMQGIQKVMEQNQKDLNDRINSAYEFLKEIL